MSRTVLLVDPNVDSLGQVASSLRARGLEVVLADELAGALARSREVQLDAVLLADSLLAEPHTSSLLDQSAWLNDVPRFVLTAEPRPDAPANHLPRSDPELMVRRLLSLPPRVSELTATRGDFRGDLGDVTLPDLLQLLGMNHRTGSLGITTPSGTGEVRLVEGEVVDAVYRRVEGKKALYRLLREQQGSFSFSSTAPTALQRIREPSHMLVLEGLRQLDEERRLLRALGTDNDVLQSTTTEERSVDDPLERALLTLLVTPRTALEVLDLLPQSDLELLLALHRLFENQRIRRIEQGASRTELADPETLSVLSAIVGQRRPKGFFSNTRVVLFGSSFALSAIETALGRVVQSVAEGPMGAVAAFPRCLATLRLGEGVELDIIGLLDVLHHSPLWGLCLAGTSVAVSLPNSEHTSLLLETCQLLGVPVIDSSAVIGEFDEGDPRQVALLVRCALESVVVS